MDVQVTEATRFIERKGWRLVDVYRDDQEHTGRREFQKRKAFRAMLNDAEDARFDIVIVRDATRLGGDTSRTMRAVEDLRENGIAVWYYIEDREVRLDKWSDKALFAMQSAASEGERDAIASRTLEALSVKARAGYNVGGSCYGYDNVPVLEGSVKKRTEYRVNEGEAAIVREVFERYAAGDGLRSIARMLNGRGIPSPRAGKRGTGSWSISVVRPMLQRDRYRGVLVYGRLRKTYRKGTRVRVTRPDQELVRCDAPHLRIVSDELWNAVQSRFRGRDGKGTAGTRGRKPRYMLSSLARCAECGGPMHAKRAKVGAEAAMVYLCGYFQDRAACTNSLRRPVHEVNQRCVEWIQRSVLTEEIVGAILAEVRKRIAERTKSSASELPELEARAKRLRPEIANLAEAVALTGSAVPVLAAKLTERQDRLNSLEARVKLLHAAPSVLTLEVRRLEAGVRKRIAEFRDLMAQDEQQARRVMESLLDGPLTFKPVETAGVKRYQVEGRIVTGALLQTDDPQCRRPQGDSNPR